ncbi:MAG: flavodoxin family protein [Candidatus Methanoplasma sp.]|jgi:multimeric flavodoxin WrbA|nr:flavodoxin family protein [Candidatus Methanoplasma sp.]
MKVVAFNCSPRRDGNTCHMIKDVLRILESGGIETEMVQVGGHDLHGCRACGSCARTKDMRCIMDDDMLNTCVQKIVAADGVIIGSPTYFSDVTSETKALIDRAGYVIRMNGIPTKRKVGAAIVAVRRAGAVHTFNTINQFFTINEMIVVGSSYWNLSVAWKEGDYEKDAEGVRTMKDLGENMAWLLEKIGGKSNCPP